MKDKLDNLIKAAHEYADSCGELGKMTGLDIDLVTHQVTGHLTFTPPIPAPYIQNIGAFNQVFCDGEWCDVDGD